LRAAATIVKAPMRKIAKRIVLFFFGRRTLKSSGKGMLSIIRSLEMLKTALTIR
jgi:hypothetical protein